MTNDDGNWLTRTFKRGLNEGEDLLTELQPLGKFFSSGNKTPAWILGGIVGLLMFAPSFRNTAGSVAGIGFFATLTYLIYRGAVGNNTSPPIDSLSLAQTTLSPEELAERQRLESLSHVGQGSSHTPPSLTTTATTVDSSTGWPANDQVDHYSMNGAGQVTASAWTRNSHDRAVFDSVDGKRIQYPDGRTGKSLDLPLTQ